MRRVESRMLLLTIFLQFLDVFLPPAKLPTPENQQHDRLVDAMSFIVWAWSLTLAEQILLSIAATLLVWGGFVGATAILGGKSRGPSVWSAVGTTVALSGWALRRWAKHTLAASFTYQVSLPPTLLTNGPYAWFIHPGYSGSLLHVCGIFILAAEPMGQRAGPAFVAATMGLAVAVLSVRMHDEEAMLHAHFKTAWVAHTASRWRLMPFVW